MVTSSCRWLQQMLLTIKTFFILKLIEKILVPDNRQFIFKRKITFVTDNWSFGSVISLTETRKEFLYCRWLILIAIIGFLIDNACNVMITFNLVVRFFLKFSFFWFEFSFSSQMIIDSFNINTNKWVFRLAFKISICFVVSSLPVDIRKAQNLTIALGVAF